MKPILPSLKENKRYLAFQIHSKTTKIPLNPIEKAICSSFREFVGENEFSGSGYHFLKEKFDNENMAGIIRVNRNFEKKLVAGLCLVDSIENVNVTPRSLAISGTLQKAGLKMIFNHKLIEER